MAHTSSSVALARSTTHADEADPAPRWGRLAAAVLAALLTGAWIGGELPTADADMAQVRSAQAAGK